MSREHNQARKEEPQSASKNQKSRLVGWLVSYQLDERGKAFEVRSGRTLITAREGMGERCITLEEHSISSPHSAMSASPRHQVMVQDIFSEHGTYLRKSSSGEEIAVTAPVTMEHGDWLRIGERTRFQLCLIDSSKR